MSVNRDSKNLGWGKEFILIDENIICPSMKMNSLEKIYDTLLNEKNEITIADDVLLSAQKCIKKMLDLNV